MKQACQVTNLDVVFSNRVPNEHGVKGGNFINSHPEREMLFIQIFIIITLKQRSHCFNNSTLQILSILQFSISGLHDIRVVEAVSFSNCVKTYLLTFNLFTTMIFFWLVIIVCAALLTFSRTRPKFGKIGQKLGVLLERVLLERALSADTSVHDSKFQEG